MSEPPDFRPVARNRRARYDYAIDDVFECGIMLLGSEVKSLRGGRVSINESFAVIREGEAWLLNADIPEYAASLRSHGPRRPRKLLLKRRELDRLQAAVSGPGMTLVPMAIYFNRQGIAKLRLGLGKGKRQADKRDTIRDRDWQRQRQRLLGRG
ncbi:MAG: SsrA-binding protein SmpB [Alphaproteobacteria bacterium]